MFHVRPGKPEDYGYVVEPMCHAMFPRYKPMHPDRFYPWFRGRVNGMLARSTLIVAVADDDDDAILGWAMFEGNCLHFVHIRPEAKPLGVAAALFKYLEHVSSYSHKGGLKAPTGLEYRPDLG